MCRIAGILTEAFDVNGSTLLVKRMCDAMAHGGPDDEGIHNDPGNGLTFGHRRLSLIDLTSGGHQPMADTDQRAWITFNGEIYNFQELRMELMALGSIFKSQTDTEVVLEAYLRWGINSFALLRGMFAFALYDVEARLTYLVRDSAGIKPLYYRETNDSVVFASEVKAFRAAYTDIEVDETWPVRFLAFGHLPEPHTTLKKVYSLAKGHFLCWDNVKKSHFIKPYVGLAKPAEHITNAAEARSIVCSNFDKAIQRQLVADAPIGVFLSGGIDSSIVALMARKHKKRELKTVSVYFNEKDYNESIFQDIVKERIGVENNSHLVTRQDFDAALPAITTAMDMPTNDGINTWFISKFAHSDGLKAVLSGIGGDEIFGGYPSFKRMGALRLLKKLPPMVLKSFSQVSPGRFKRLGYLTHDHPFAEYLFLRGLFNISEIAAILKISKDDVSRILFSEQRQPTNLEGKSRAAWLETNLYMQNQLLRDTDVMSMAHGLEVRLPFLDEDFTAQVGLIAPRLRYSRPPAKKLLIESFRDLLPTTVWKRKKMGFSFPLQDWMRHNGQITDAESYSNPEAAQLIHKFRQGKLHWSKAYALFQLQQHSTADIAPVKKVILLSLQTFSSTGGIQKMTRNLAGVLQSISRRKNWKTSLMSLYDQPTDLNDKYLSFNNFIGFSNNRIDFVKSSVKRGREADVVILTHINLAVVGVLIKMLNPRCKVWLIAHGIEIWRPLNFIKKRLLIHCDKIICVSHYTKEKLQWWHETDASKLVILNNALDPVSPISETFAKPAHLLNRYSLTNKNKVILTVARLTSTEQYKGYEQVMKAVSRLVTQFPEIKYILAGQYDEIEKCRINRLVRDLGLENYTIVTGFVEEAELSDHFLVADVFVLPSKKEGFGIVFIEALAHGLPVICGNQDGSADAIRNGELGVAINPDNLDELTDAIAAELSKPLTENRRRNLQQQCLQYFNSDDYSDKIEQMLSE